MKKGFSFIELIIAIGVIGILSVMVTTSFTKAQLRKKQQGIVDGIVSQLEKQKADTQAGKAGLSYGVRFATSSYTLFTGTTFSSTTASNVVVPIDASFFLSESISNTNNIIFFSRVTGKVNETATITVSEITNKVTPQRITIESTGAISVIN